MHGLARTPDAFTYCQAGARLLLQGHILISLKPGTVREMRCPIKKPRQKQQPPPTGGKKKKKKKTAGQGNAES